MRTDVRPPVTVRAALYRLFWRLHFWAGLITAPLVIAASITGLIYVVTPQMEAWRHAQVDRVAVGQNLQALDAQVASARSAHPDRPLRFVVPAHQPGQTTQVHFGPDPAGPKAVDGLPSGLIVYVNPYTAEVVGTLDELQRYRHWARKLHASFLQGERWRWPIELAASWLLVMLITGWIMWWPRGGLRALGGSLRWRGPGPLRARWRRWHTTGGVLMTGVLAVIVVTGLTWSAHTGERFRAAQQALGQSAPRPAADLVSAVPADGRAPLTWQAAYEAARALSPDIAMMLTAPRGPEGVWRAENFDRSQPTRRFVLVLDAYRAQPLFFAGWDEMPLLARATAVGIPFHRGEFGWWNQALLIGVALACIGAVVSGLRMAWLRRPSGGGPQAPALPASGWRAAPLGLWLLLAALAWAQPVFAWSLLAYGLAEGVAAVVHRRRVSTVA
ncbi:MAG: PepSY-associated TM helix domain-containing protein [Caldimonas sp.]|jgi:uncharacterized iron-regulated membrane protein|uniref:PepSY-associated TM helix domain-containing protein n=1 Tax=Caldimonas sp. TaxID=2838790 RepID=UPI00391CF674